MKLKYFIPILGIFLIKMKHWDKLSDGQQISFAIYHSIPIFIFIIMQSLEP